MRRWIVKGLILTGSFLFVPQLVHAEGEDRTTLNSIETLINEQAGLLENTLKETAETVDVLVEGTAEIPAGVAGTVDTTVKDASEIVKQTENNLSESESNTIPTVVNQTTKTVENTANNIKSVINKTTEIAKETVKATSGVTKNIPKATNNLKDNLEKTTDAIDAKMEASVEETVEKFNKTMNPATDVIDEIPVSINSMPVIEPDEPAQIGTADSENEKEAISGDKETLSGMEIQKLKTLMESATLVEQVNQKNRQGKESKSEQTWNLKQPSQSQQEKPSPYESKGITVTPPSSMSSSYSSANSTSSLGIGDGLMGVLVLPFNQSGLSKESWKPGNKFALKLWIYDPLGHPPKFTPFLHLI